MIELVTEPELSSPEEAREFMNALISVLTYLGIFDPQTGILKADCNVSIKKTGFTRVEVKNVSGFKEIERALAYELERQQEDTVVRETRAWNAKKGLTLPMRAKELEEDYGYIVEPDIPKIVIENKWIKELKKSIPELALEKSQRFVKTFKIDPVDASIICADPNLAQFYEVVAKKTNSVIAARWVRKELVRALNLKNVSIKEAAMSPEQFSELITLIASRSITNIIARELTEKLVEKSFSPKAFVQKKKLTVIGGTSELTKLCKQVIKKHPEAVKDYKAGEIKAVQFLVGQVMKNSKGKANPKVLQEIFRKLLD